MAHIELRTEVDVVFDLARSIDTRISVRWASRMSERLPASRPA